MKNSIVGTAAVPPTELLKNPKNHRRHGPEQQAAMLGILDAVGWVGEIMVNRVTNTVLDGHLRLELAALKGEATVPVKYVEIPADREDAFVVAYDASTALADNDRLAAHDLAKLLAADSVAKLVAPTLGVDWDKLNVETPPPPEEEAPKPKFDVPPPPESAPTETVQVGNFVFEVDSAVYEDWAAKLRAIYGPLDGASAQDEVLRRLGIILPEPVEDSPVPA